MMIKNFNRNLTLLLCISRCLLCSFVDIMASIVFELYNKRLRSYFCIYLKQLFHGNKINSRNHILYFIHLFGK